MFDVVFYHNILEIWRVKMKNEIVVKGGSPGVQETAQPISDIDMARKISGRVAEVIDQCKLSLTIKGHKYIKVEGWSTMGALFGLFPVIVDLKEVTRPQDKKGEIRFVATAEIRDREGRTVSRAVGEASNREYGKSKHERFQISSMAQTRAVAKAYKLCLSWVMALQGYETTPAEEITPQIKKEIIKNRPAKQTKPGKTSVDDIIPEEWE